MDRCCTMNEPPQHKKSCSDSYRQRPRAKGEREVEPNPRPFSVDCPRLSSSLLFRVDLTTERKGEEERREEEEERKREEGEGEGE